jgi:Flp pilus assembly protein TadG
MELAKVTIVRNGESKEYSVTRTDHCRHPGEVLPILTCIKHNGMCSMTPSWPAFKKGTQSARAFWNDTSGVILPYVTVMLVAIVGLSVLALDGARLMSLQTQLQNGADALALAGAAELDRLPDAETRARTAIQRLLTNSTLFGSGASRTIAVSNIKFYSGLPANDASPMSAGTPATGPGNARFVSVSVRPVTLPTILPAAFFGGASTVTTTASAVAGFDQVVCGVTPIYVCNPYETAGMTYDQATEALQQAAANPSDQARLMRLRQYDGNAPYVAANYGFLDSPTLGSDEASLIDSISIVRPAACFLQRGVNLRAGFVQSVREGFNVRFDIYEGAMSEKYNDSNYRPAQNVRKGYVLASGDENQNACAARRGANWPIGIPPIQVTGLPLDRSWPIDGMGEGNWDFDTYWQVNHGDSRRPPNLNGGPASNADAPSRYRVYRYEIEQGHIADISVGGESGAPACYSGGDLSGMPERRILHAAVVNCLSLQLEGEVQFKVPVAAFGKFFLTLPLGSKTDLYVEMVGLVRPGDGVSFDVVQLYR